MGTKTKRLRIAVTCGDPFGIGPEVACAAAAKVVHEVTLYGDPQSLGDTPCEIVAVPVEGERPERPGPSAAGGRAALAALDRALTDLRAGRQDLLVTAPISKESCVLAGGTAEGHTPLLGRFFEAEPLMAFCWDEQEPVVALLTVHMPLKAVASALTSERVERAVRLLERELRSRFQKTQPRIGVLGLNPHAGEGGRMGTEEADHLIPALRRLRDDGFDVEGPLPGDTAFAVRERYDALLAMYHDQGLGPVKALAFTRAVNVTLGLPIVRTSPAHGTAFDIAGTGKADPTSMMAALEWGARLASAP